MIRCRDQSANLSRYTKGNQLNFHRQGRKQAMNYTRCYKQLQIKLSLGQYIQILYWLARQQVIQMHLTGISKT
jgi:hypothetical protein